VAERGAVLKTADPPFTPGAGRFTAEWWPSVVVCPKCRAADTVLTAPWRSAADNALSWIYRCDRCGHAWRSAGPDA